MTAATTKGGALRGASDPSIDALRKARLALRQAIDDGAGYLVPVLDEVEDELIEALGRARRGAQLDLGLEDECRLARWDAPGAPCRDCGRQTIPDEYYMVNDDAWPIGRGDGCLCIGCLEARLGRRLTPADFPPLPINEPSPIDSPRLRDRKGHRR